jgi:hypothetical protein
VWEWTGWEDEDGDGGGRGRMRLYTGVIVCEKRDGEVRQTLACTPASVEKNSLNGEELDWV